MLPELAKVFERECIFEGDGDTSFDDLFEDVFPVEVSGEGIAPDFGANKEEAASAFIGNFPEGFNCSKARFAVVKDDLVNFINDEEVLRCKSAKKVV